MSNEELNMAAKKIAIWALDLKDEATFDKYYIAQPYPVPMSRDIDSNRMLFGVIIEERQAHPKRGCLINILKNGDVVGRGWPFYDGDMRDLIPVWNQRDIFEFSVKLNMYR